MRQPRLVNNPSLPELFIKNVDMYAQFCQLIFYTYSYIDSINRYVLDLFSIYNRFFLLYEQSDLTASTLLQRIRSERPQLHPLRLVSTATSTRE